MLKHFMILDRRKRLLEYNGRPRGNFRRSQFDDESPSFSQASSTLYSSLNDMKKLLDKQRERDTPPLHTEKDAKTIGKI